MKRTPMPPRKHPLRRTALGRGLAKRVRRARPRLTGPTRGQRAVVVARATVGGVVRCELCGTWAALTWSVHHRQPRGMGGSRAESNTPERLLLVCGSGTSGCHHRIESQRAAAYTAGWLVRRPTDPATVPALLWFGPRYLTADGGYEEVA